MTTPFIRAKAKDAVDALDNLTAYLDPDTRNEVMQYMVSTFKEIGKVITHALESGTDPVAGYNAFVAKFNEYSNAPSDP